MNIRLSIIASTLLLTACDQVNDLPIKYPGQQQEEPNTEAVQDNRAKAPITLKKAETMPYEEVELITNHLRVLPVEAVEVIGSGLL